QGHRLVHLRRESDLHLGLRRPLDHRAYAGNLGAVRPGCADGQRALRGGGGADGGRGGGRRAPLLLRAPDPGPAPRRVLAGRALPQSPPSPRARASRAKITAWLAMMMGTRNVGSRLSGSTVRARIEAGSARASRPAVRTTSRMSTVPMR